MSQFRANVNFDLNEISMFDGELPDQLFQWGPQQDAQDFADVSMADANQVNINQTLNPVNTNNGAPSNITPAQLNELINQLNPYENAPPLPEVNPAEVNALLNQPAVNQNPPPPPEDNITPAQLNEMLSQADLSKDVVISPELVTQLEKQLEKIPLPPAIPQPPSLAAAQNAMQLSTTNPQPMVQTPTPVPAPEISSFEDSKSRQTKEPKTRKRSKSNAQRTPAEEPPASASKNFSTKKQSFSGRSHKRKASTDSNDDETPSKRRQRGNGKAIPTGSSPSTTSTSKASPAFASPRSMLLASPFRPARGNMPFQRAPTQGTAVFNTPCLPLAHTNTIQPDLSGTTPSQPTPTRYLRTPLSTNTPMNQHQQFPVPKTPSPPQAGQQPVDIPQSIKRGLCAAVQSLVSEASNRGTIFDQALLEGTQTDFASAETRHTVMVTTKPLVAEILYTNPENDRQAYSKGAFRVFQMVMEEMKDFGTVFGQLLMEGPVDGVREKGMKQAFGRAWQELIKGYRAPEGTPSSSSLTTPTSGAVQERAVPSAPVAERRVKRKLPSNFDEMLAVEKAAREDLSEADSDDDSDDSKSSNDDRSDDSDSDNDDNDNNNEGANGASPRGSNNQRSNGGGSSPSNSRMRARKADNHKSSESQPPRKRVRKSSVSDRADEEVDNNTPKKPRRKASPKKDGQENGGKLTREQVKDLIRDLNLHQDIPNLPSYADIPPREEVVIVMEPEEEGAEIPKPHRGTARKSKGKNSGSGSSSPSGCNSEPFCVPKALFSFKDYTFYMVTGNGGPDGAERKLYNLGNEGTEAMGDEFRQFLNTVEYNWKIQADQIPENFEWRQWLTLEQNLANLFTTCSGGDMFHQ